MTPETQQFLLGLSAELAPQAALLERTARLLEPMLVQPAAAGQGTTAALAELEAAFARLAWLASLSRPPPGLAEFQAARHKALLHRTHAVAALRAATAADKKAQADELAQARREAAEAQGSQRRANAAIATALSVAGELAAAVPLVGGMLNAVLLAIVAVQQAIEALHRAAAEQQHQQQLALAPNHPLPTLRPQGSRFPP
jgi:hypothetical protein